jgi:hypothetical protein
MRGACLILKLLSIGRAVIRTRNARRKGRMQVQDVCPGDGNERGQVVN